MFSTRDRLKSFMFCAYRFYNRRWGRGRYYLEIAVPDVSEGKTDDGNVPVWHDRYCRADLYNYCRIRSFDWVSKHVLRVFCVIGMPA